MTDVTSTNTYNFTTFMIKFFSYDFPGVDLEGGCKRVGILQPFATASSPTVQTISDHL
jgi:hypothetical protein